MNRSTRRVGVVAATAVAALSALATAAVAGPSSASATPAARVSSGAQPGIKGGPPHVLAGRVTPGLKAKSDAVVFSCQAADAPLVCYGPQQVRRAYGIDSLVTAGYNGKGKTIVIVDAYQSPTIQQDLADFNAAFGLRSAPLQVVAPQSLTPFDPNDSNQVGWSQEITLDVEWAHAIAPGAKIVLALAKSNNDNDLQATVKYVVDHRLGDVLSQSFGEAESCYGVNADGSHQPGTTLAAQHKIFQQAAAKNMTVFAAAGDSGSTQPTCDGAGSMIAASTPASDPLVTGVGGTELFANPVSGKYDHEVVWNEEAQFGYRSSGGGGFSNTYGVPAFQRSAGSLPSRGVPDVTYNAAINGGVLVAYSAVVPRGSFYIFGGTSSGTPQWSGLIADIAQKNGSALGDINPALYQIAGATPGAFRDITVGENGDFGLGGFTAGTGWDAASGLGSPQAGALTSALVALR